MREYRLDRLRIQATEATAEEIAKFRQGEQSHVLGNVLRKILPACTRIVLNERHFHFDPELMSVRGQVLLNGYWQSEKYFKEIEPMIRSEFAFKEGPDEINGAIVERMARSASVSIHIRRGDYAHNPSTHEVHGLCSLDYYKRAMDVVGGRVQTPHYYVFSDDPNWAIRHLGTSDDVTCVSHNGGQKISRTSGLSVHASTTSLPTVPSAGGALGSARIPTRL